MLRLLRPTILAVCGCISIWALPPLTQLANPMQNEPPGPHTLERTVRAAMLKGSIKDKETTLSLADTVLTIPHRFLVSDMVRPLIKERLATAESAYLNGRGPGVSESSLVNVLNSFVRRLALPEFAQTSVKQVRVLRLKLLLREPMFMGQGLATSAREAGDSISETMSPLQAAELALTLIDQKFFNPEYQLSPQVWDAAYSQETIKELHARVDAVRHDTSGKASTTASLSMDKTPRRGDLEAAISNAFSSLSLSDELQMLDEAIVKLGI